MKANKVRLLYNKDIEIDIYVCATIGECTLQEC